MGMIEPREYQREALRRVLTAWKEGHTRQLISLPTGTGKTVIFGLIAEALRVRTLILAHREELLYQAEQKIHFVYPDADIGILKAEERGGLNAEICIASIQIATRRTEELSERGLTEGLLPLDYCMGVCEDYARKLDGAKYALKSAEWRKDPATEKQLNTLRKMGIRYHEGISKGEACELLNEVLNVKATEKQIHFISRYGLHTHPDMLNKQEARKIIGEYLSVN